MAVNIRQPGVVVTIRRDREHAEQIVARVTKSWWGGPGVGGLSRQLGEVWIDATGMSELEAIAAACSDVAIQIRGGLYDL